MSIRGRVALANPETVEMTVQITATIKEWQEIYGRIAPIETYEINRIKGLINKAVFKARNSFVERIDEVEEER